MYKIFYIILFLKNFQKINILKIQIFILYLFNYTLHIIFNYFYNFAQIINQILIIKIQIYLNNKIKIQIKLKFYKIMLNLKFNNNKIYFININIINKIKQKMIQKTIQKIIQKITWKIIQKIIWKIMNNFMNKHMMIYKIWILMIFDYFIH